MKHSPQRRGSSSGLAWPQCTGVMPCRVCQCLLSDLLLLLGVRGHSHIGTGVRAKMQEAHLVPEPPKWGCGLGFSLKYPCLLLNSWALISVCFHPGLQHFQALVWFLGPCVIVSLAPEYHPRTPQGLTLSHKQLEKGTSCVSF